MPCIGAQQNKTMITAYNSDCLEAMRLMKDNEFDLAIVDPPYGIGIDGQLKSVSKNSKHNRKHHERKNWDSEIPSKEYFDEVHRVSKNAIIWGANYFVEHLKQGHKGWIIWDKAQHGLTMSDCELAYSTFDCPTRIYTKNRAVLISQNTIHPTEKPIHLYKWLLMNYANQGDKILDTHGGSFSHAIACHNLGFDLTIFEIDKDYFDAGMKRLAQHQQQLTMF